MKLESVIKNILSESNYLDKVLPKSLAKMKSLLPEVSFSTKGKDSIIGKWNKNDLIIINFSVDNDDWTDYKDVDIFDINVEYKNSGSSEQQPGFSSWINNYDKEFKALNAALKTKDDKRIEDAIDNLF